MRSLLELDLRNAKLHTSGDSPSLADRRSADNGSGVKFLRAARDQAPDTVLS